MYEIRHYYKDKDNKLVYHTVSYSKEFSELYETLIKSAEFLSGINDIVFIASMPKNMIENFVNYLEKRNKELMTIVECSEKWGL